MCFVNEYSILLYFAVLRRQLESISKTSLPNKPKPLEQQLAISAKQVLLDLLANTTILNGYIRDQCFSQSIVTPNDANSYMYVWVSPVSPIRVFNCR